MLKRALLSASVAFAGSPIAAQPASPPQASPTHVSTVAPPGFPGVAKTSLDAATRKKVITTLSMALRQRYVFPDVGAKAASRIEAALAAGEYNSLADPAAFAARLTSDIGDIAHDKHLRINAMAAPPAPIGAGAMAAPKAEAGVVRADRLAGDVGYIELIGFPPRQSFKPVIDRAMAVLKGSKALIIDDRRNGGGDPAAVDYAVSFFVPPARHLHINDIVIRTAGTTDFTRQEMNSEPTPVSFAGIPIYVLTSHQTFSGGEEFAYDVKTLRLGKIVGEVTGGGANPTGPVALGNGLVALIPFGRSENPITKTNWEGRGVQPDILVPATEALKVALEKLGEAGIAEVAAASREQVFAPRSIPLPGTETALRSLVAGLASGTPDYAEMGPDLAGMTRQQLPSLHRLFSYLGAMKSITFFGPSPAGGDAFELTFVNGQLVMSIDLGPDGKVIGSMIRASMPAG